MGISHVLVDLFVKEGLAPAIKAQPNAVVLYLVYGPLEETEVHYTLLSINCPQSCMTEGAFKLADVGRIYFPLVWVARALGTAKPEL